MNGRYTLFRAHDIRGKREAFAGTEGERLGAALALYFIHTLKATRVVLARDARLGGAELQQQLLSVFCKAGLEVLLEPNPIGTCQFYYACLSHIDAAAVMVTASHNPASYLGMKLVGPNLQVISMGHGPVGGLELIQQLYEANEPINENGRQGSVHMLDTLGAFITYSAELANVGSRDVSGLSVGCDFQHGSAGCAIGRALGELGVHYSALHLIPNGNFPQGDPNPGIEASMQDAKAFLAVKPLPLFFAYDGDGDRMDVLYKGRQLSPSLVLLSIADELVNLNKDGCEPTFLFDVKASPPLLFEMRRRGYKVAIVQPGHSAVKQRMNSSRTDFLLCAAEESAHYYYQLKGMDGTRYASENTLFYTLLILKAYKKNPSLFETARALQDAFYREREWSVSITDEQDRSAFLEKVQLYLLSRGAKAVSHDSRGNSLGATLYRYGLDEGATLSASWFQVFQRLSQSEDNLLRFEVLASDQGLGRSIAEAVKALQSGFHQTR
jgi:phosphomannomutase